MKKIILLILLGAVNYSFAQQKVLAFCSNEADSNSIRLFVNQDFRIESFEVTTDWGHSLKGYDVVIWANAFPKKKSDQAEFKKYIERGGAWIGFNNVSDPRWKWFTEFLGSNIVSGTSKPALPARLSMNKDHPVTQNVPAYITAPINEWLQWKPNPRDSKDVRVIATLDRSNYPLGIDNILTGGDMPVIWANTKFRMVYINMGLGTESMSDWLQKRLIGDALHWVTNGSVPKRKEIVTGNYGLPEMISVQGGTYTMGEDAGDKDTNPAHRVSVTDFRIAKTETTLAQWRKFCVATGRKMPEEPWFQQSEQHPVINVSWDHAMAYCQWLSDVTGKHYRLPTEAEWEYAARGGMKSNGFPYSGSNIADSVAWLGRNTNGTMPVAQKTPNELGLYDMTGNVWEWCSDWYAADYYKVSEKENPKGPVSGEFYTLRGGAWDIGLRNNRIVYRNPLAPMSRNHNKGFRVVCDQ